MKHRTSRSLGIERRVAADTTTPGEYVVTMAELDVDVCWRLIASSGVGRVAFVREGEPWALPVNCAVVNEQIVFRTRAESMLHQLREGSVVQFEVDSVERVAESGWSVVARGHLFEVTDEQELARISETGLHPWAPGGRDRWMAIVPTEVSGRVICRGFEAGHGGPPPCMPPD